MNGRLVIDRLCEYILLLRSVEAEHSSSEAKYRESEKLRSAELDALYAERQVLREANEKSKAEINGLREELEQMKEGFLFADPFAGAELREQDLKLGEGRAGSATCPEKSAVDLEFKECN